MSDYNLKNAIRAIIDLHQVEIGSDLSREIESEYLMGYFEGNESKLGEYPEIVRCLLSGRSIFDED